MLRASALFYAVTVALLIGMISGALVLLTHFRDVEMEHWLARERASANARSAVQLACVRDLTGGTTHALDLFGDGRDSAYVLGEAYGLMDRIAVRARVADDEVELSAYIGPRESTEQVLVLGGNTSGAVSLGGDTRILGDVVVPGGDVRRGYIEGRPFNGEKLVYGSITASPPGPVRLSAPALLRMEQWCRGHGSPQQPLLTLPELHARPDSDIVLRPCPVVDLHGLRRLENVDLRGPLVLRSNDTLEIGNDAHLDMVVVQAPFISITTLRPSVMQCFAEQGVHVGAGVVLEYPSALVVVPPDTVPGLYAIVIDSAVVEGAVIATTSGATPDVRTMVSLARGAIVRGEVFCDGLAEERGTVEGILQANGLLLRTASSTYRGHLLDAVLRQERPGAAMGALGTGKDERKRILQWTVPQHRRKARA